MNAFGIAPIKRAISQGAHFFQTLAQNELNRFRGGGAAINIRNLLCFCHGVESDAEFSPLLICRHEPFRTQASRAFQNRAPAERQLTVEDLLEHVAFLLG